MSKISLTILILAALVALALTYRLGSLHGVRKSQPHINYWHEQYEWQRQELEALLMMEESATVLTTGEVLFIDAASVKKVTESGGFEFYYYPIQGKVGSVDIGDKESATLLLTVRKAK